MMLIVMMRMIVAMMVMMMVKRMMVVMMMHRWSNVELINVTMCNSKFGIQVQEQRELRSLECTAFFNVTAKCRVAVSTDLTTTKRTQVCQLLINL